MTYGSSIARLNSFESVSDAWEWAETLTEEELKESNSKGRSIACELVCIGISPKNMLTRSVLDHSDRHGRLTGFEIIEKEIIPEGFMTESILSITNWCGIMLAEYLAERLVRCKPFREKRWELMVPDLFAAMKYRRGTASEIVLGILHDTPRRRSGTFPDTIRTGGGRTPCRTTADSLIHGKDSWRSRILSPERNCGRGRRA